MADEWAPIAEAVIRGDEGPPHQRADLEQALVDDLLDLYHRTCREVTYVRPSGKVGAYWPRRFLRMIKRWHLDFDPSRIVEATARMVTKPTTIGFGIIEDANRLDLSVEVLVVDADKPYHHLFSPTAVQAAHARLEGYLLRRSPAAADAGQ